MTIGRWRTRIGIAAFVSLALPARAEVPPDFATRVVPVLTKAGCNAGSCHGAALGRGGFRLSLLGYDPGADYDSLVYEFEGRRVNTASPERSLVRKKGSAAIKHEGGPRLATGGEGYRVLRDWIAAGAPRGRGRSPSGLEVEPSAAVLDRTGQVVLLRVTARYDDGSSEDVTRWAVYAPADSEAVRCSALGEVTALRRGHAAITVRFLGAVGCVTVTVPLSDSRPKTAVRPRANSIDDHDNRTLDELRLDHAPRADDETFLRRARLDLTGQLPGPDEVAEFLADRAPGKHARLVERLLASPEYADHRAYKWGDLLRIESGRLGPAGAAAFLAWVREAVAHNTPLDEMALELVLSLGDGDRVGPANFSLVAADARSQAGLVSQVLFLRLGGLSALGLGLDDALRRRARADAPRSPLRNCILVWLDGGPSHLEAFDQKHDAPAEIRGPYRPTATNVPGLAIGEHFGRLARVMDRVGVVRSMTSELGEHNFGRHSLLTGYKPSAVLENPSSWTSPPMSGAGFGA